MASHGHGHGHGHAASARLEVTALARRSLLLALAVAAVATVVGLVLLRPDGARVQEIADRAEFTAPGVTFADARVLEVGDDCGEAGGESCALLRVEVLEGAGEGDEAELQVPEAVVGGGLRAGDTVQVQRQPAAPGGEDDASGGGGGEATYAYFATDRDVPLGLLAGLFALVVVAVARWRGLLALVGLGFAGAVIVFFTLPALLAGGSGPWVALVSGAAIMFVVLYTTHGPSLRTSTALGGTLIGIALTAAIGAATVHWTRLAGISDESSNLLSAFADELSFQGLLICAVIVAGLGVLNDVTITQASSVWEVRAAAPTMSRREVYRAGMRIGRDHIASTIYTIVFAYAGSALAVLMLLYLYDRPVLGLVSSEELATEIVRTLVTSIGLVLALPVTTALAALVAGPGSAVAAPSGGGGDDGPRGGHDEADADADERESYWLRRAQRPRGGRRRAT